MMNQEKNEEDYNDPEKRIARMFKLGRLSHTLAGEFAEEHGELAWAACYFASDKMFDRSARCWKRVGRLDRAEETYREGIKYFDSLGSGVTAAGLAHEAGLSDLEMRLRIKYDICNPPYLPSTRRVSPGEEPEPGTWWSPTAEAEGHESEARMTPPADLDRILQKIYGLRHQEAYKRAEENIDRSTILLDPLATPDTAEIDLLPSYLQGTVYRSFAMVASRLGFPDPHVTALNAKAIECFNAARRDG